MAMAAYFRAENTRQSLEGSGGLAPVPNPLANIKCPHVHLLSLNRLSGFKKAASHVAGRQGQPVRVIQLLVDRMGRIETLHRAAEIAHVTLDGSEIVQLGCSAELVPSAAVEIETLREHSLCARQVALFLQRNCLQCGRRGNVTQVALLRKKLLRLSCDIHCFADLPEILKRPPFVIERLRKKQGFARGLCFRGSHGGGSRVALEVALGLSRARVHEVNAGILARRGRQAAQHLDRYKRIFPLARIDLSVCEGQSVVQVVGEEFEEGAVDLDRLSPVRDTSS